MHFAFGSNITALAVISHPYSLHKCATLLFFPSSSNSETTLRAKWKSLRDYFIVECGKRQLATLKTRTGKPPKSKWQFYQQLLFLSDIVASKASSESVSIDSPPEIKPTSLICYESGTESPNEDGEADTHAPGVSTDIADFEAPEIGHTQVYLSESWKDKTKTQAKLSTKRKRDDVEVNLEDFSDMEEKQIQCFRRRRKKTESSDDGELLFLRSLYPYLKLVPRHLRLSARNRIQSVLEEFAFPQATDSTKRSQSNQYNVTIHSQDQNCQDRATPTPPYQNHSRGSTPHSFTSNISEHDIVVNTN